MIENPVEWFQTKITDVGNEPSRTVALSEMKSFVLNSDKKVLEDIIRNVSLNAIFQCLDNPAGLNDEDTEHVCVILYELMKQLSEKDLFETYREFLQRGLAHKSGEVTRIVLKLIDRNINEDTTEASLDSISHLIPDIVACLDSSEDRYPEGAKSVLIKIGTNPFGVKLLFSNDLIKKLEGIINSKDVAKIRVCEILISVSKSSAENLSRAVGSGLLDKILSEFSSDDVIMQLCVLENLSNLATCSHGLSFLLELEFVRNLERNLLALQQQPMSSMLLPGMIEFFGTLCHAQPERFVSRNPQIMDLLFSSINTADEVLLGILIKTVGQIGSTSSGRQAISKYGLQLQNYFKMLGVILSSKNNLTVCAMSSLSELVRFIPGADEANVIAGKWLESIRPNVLESSVKISKLPFVECRMVAFGLLEAIASQRWGTRLIINYPGMVEYLLDRSTEFEKGCKECKFNIVQTIVSCPDIEEIADEQMLHHLTTFVKEGPFYVPTDLSIATEGAL